MAPNTWCRINAAERGGPAEILIYDVIGSWFADTDAGSIARQIQDLSVEQITVRINSPGGDAFDGVAIFNALRSHDARVRVVVDGLAASAASVIAMAGDEVVMGPGAQIMVHEPWMFTDGCADELRRDADRLDKMRDSLIEIYSGRAGDADWTQILADETWYTAEEAVTAGLADRVDASAAPEARTRAGAWSMKNFRYAGRESAPAPRMPAATVAEAQPRKESVMSTLIEGLRERLGIAEDADEATALAALDEALAEQEQDSAPQAAAKADLVAALEQRGMVAVDKATLDEVRARAESGAQAMERLDSMERAKVVQSHIDRGAITPAQRETYEKLLASDRETTEALLASMPPVHPAPGSELGHDADGVEDEKDTARAEQNLRADKQGLFGPASV